MRTDQELQPLAVAKLLKQVVDKEQPTVVLLGKQAIDGDTGQTGAMLAGMLGWPQASSASKIEVNDGKTHLEVDKEVDTGIQRVKIPLPAVVTADLRLNEPRYATLPNLMKAKKKPMETIDAASTGVDLTPRLQVLKVEEPPVRAGGKKVDSVDELLEKLKTEAKAPWPEAATGPGSAAGTAGRARAPGCGSGHGPLGDREFSAEGEQLHPPGGNTQGELRQDPADRGVHGAQADHLV